MPVKVKGYRKGSTYVKSHTRATRQRKEAKTQVEKISSAYNKVSIRIAKGTLTEKRKKQLESLSYRLAVKGVETFYKN